MCITGEQIRKSSAIYISAIITATPAPTSPGQEYCGNINLTLKGVTEDPSGLATPNTFQKHTSVHATVALNFDVITRFEVIATIPRGNGQCVKNAMWGGHGPAPGYGIVTGTKNEVFVDLSCEAQFRVCGISKCRIGKQTLSLPYKSHEDVLGRSLMID